MGKIARGFAHAKNVTVDPVVTGGKFVGRKTKAAASAVKSKASNAADAIRSEERMIALQKEARKAAKAQAEDLAEALVSKKETAKVKSSTTKKTKVVTTEAVDA